MTSVIVDVPAKTNLTLHVGAPRAEWSGRHALDTIYCGVGVYDTVTLTDKEPGAGFSLDLAGGHLGDLASTASDMRRNHAVLALFALAEASGRSPDVAIRLDKRIPVAAGLGGGSADAAGTLLGLNRLWNLDWPIERLRAIAATLGADMPFCLSGGYAHGTGFGEQIEPIDNDSRAANDLRQAGYCDALLIGAYHDALSTPAVYRQYDLVGAGVDRNGETDANHLQHAAISLHPRSGEAIEQALAAGARQAFVSGSGPSVIAFVPDNETAANVRDNWTSSRCVDRIIAADAPAVPRVSECR
ncbi:4-(cytidine 5'-diphospho)-2-C-methyl-D-erythritol kinase [Bifidobacterium sp. SO1]|uniref:4-(cytidine 5'-diphospho)-2-C-methyl-D-erythritol kinase n=1 Tax=Bifidobacterium sp. SO1 TaxID=2809029 RepID=UPI001BDC76D3|nr:4-(cytidine 5'-diphospho)-2-C-methyl-D-erythritol kinase [Bifidobacterium sp. SO1]MBT1162261.1 4-(cytidine 5'-diphospho)-2-C-methyl-D-erythritol kinase [Bifidobacterium sp. SO1]